MDASDYPSFLSLSRLTAQLAAHCRRIAAEVGRSSDPVDRILEATMQQEWSAVAEAARQLAADPSDPSAGPVARTVALAARALCDELDGKDLDDRDPWLAAPKGLSKLLEACRAQRLSQRRHFRTLGQR